MDGYFGEGIMNTTENKTDLSLELRKVRKELSAFVYLPLAGGAIYALIALGVHQLIVS